ncbi:MAG: hypothetical protein K6U80_00185 [Firmicutes bacterium]|nr:hypothetical protein [Bacillota bacterium]
MEGRCPEFGDEILGQRLARDGLHFVAGAFTARLGAEDCGFVKPLGNTEPMTPAGG